jgi:tetratricopeptide (TPR) repeat protein
MASSRTRLFLTHSAAVIFGAIVGVVLMIWLRAYVSRPLAAMTCYLAMQANDAGNEDKAIILLSQASVEDRDSYLPWELLAQIYLHQGKRELALELYKKALDLLNRKRDFLLLPTAHSQERNLIQRKLTRYRNNSTINSPARESCDDGRQGEEKCGVTRAGFRGAGFP